MNQETIDRLIELKGAGNKFLYYIELGGLEFIFRPLTFEENNIILDLEAYLDPVSINNTIVLMAVKHCTYRQGIDLWLEQGKAGIPDHLAQYILNVSGFNDQDKFITTVNEARFKADQLESLIECYICSAFHTMTPDMCKALSLQEQLELFAKAEVILGKPVDFSKIFKVANEADGYEPAAGMQRSDLLDNEDVETVEDLIKNG